MAGNLGVELKEGNSPLSSVVRVSASYFLVEDLAMGLNYAISHSSSLVRVSAIAYYWLTGLKRK